MKLMPPARCPVYNPSCEAGRETMTTFPPRKYKKREKMYPLLFNRRSYTKKTFFFALCTEDRGKKSGAHYLKLWKMTIWLSPHINQVTDYTWPLSFPSQDNTGRGHLYQIQVCFAGCAQTRSDATPALGKNHPLKIGSPWRRCAWARKNVLEPLWFQHCNLYINSVTLPMFELGFTVGFWK